MVGKGSMRGTRTATGLVALTCAVAVPAASGLSAPAVAAKGRHVILSPKSGKGVPAKPVLVRVHTGRKPHRFRAQLNGHPIAKYFSRPSHHGVRKLEVSLSYGLHHGRNRLHVRVGHHRTDGAKFRVWKGRPLIGAGIDRTVALGAQVLLKGRFREPPRGHSKTSAQRPAAGQAGGSQFEWSTTDAPPGSPLTAPRGSGRKATFTPEAPGRYSLQVSVPAGDGKSAFDTTAVKVDPPPAVPVDTMFPTGDTLTAVKVGDQVYKPEADDPYEVWAQLVALDRKTLTPVTGQLADLANKTYTCQRSADCPRDLSSDLARLGPDEIAIVTNPYPPNAYFNGACNPGDDEVPVGLEPVLSRIGVSATGFDDQPTQLCAAGGISAIGVPGTKPGEGDWHSVATSTRMGAGRMQGYLVFNNGNHYAFTGYDHVDFDTAADGSTPSHNVIQVGDTSFPQDFPGGIRDGGGFQVVVLDAQTLNGDSYWYETDHSDRSALVGQLTAMRNKIHDANTVDGQHQKLVIVESLGSPVIQYYRNSHITAPDDGINAAVSGLVDEVERLGGTRNAFYKMLDPALYGHNSYTLLSTSNRGPGQGDETVGDGITGTGSGPLNSAPMSGTLARTGPNYRFELQGSPLIGSASADGSLGTGSAQLMHVAFQQPTQWPERGNEGRTAAICWIGMNLLGTDIRSQYWTQDTGWDKVGAEIQGLKYPDLVRWSQQPANSKLCAGTWTADDLDWAKEELAGTDPARVTGEIGWLETTQGYFNSLAQPFADGALKDWASLQSMAANINGNVGADKSSSIEASIEDFFDFGRGLLEITPEVGEAFIAVNDAYDLVVGLAETKAGKPVEDDFLSSVAQVGTDLADRLDGARAMLKTGLPHVIVADYAKLKTVGSCASQFREDWADCPYEHSDWEYTPADQTAAKSALLATTNAWAYGQLLPARYNLYRLQPWWRTRVDGTDSYSAYGPGCNLGGCVPFGQLPQPDQLARPIYRNMPSYGHQITDGRRRAGVPARSSGDTWQIDALGSVTGEGTFDQPYKMTWPDASVMNAVFGHGTNADGSRQLGLDPEQFFDSNFKTQTLVHYKWQDTLPPEWCGAYPDVCAESGG